MVTVLNTTHENCTDDGISKRKNVLPIHRDNENVTNVLFQSLPVTSVQSTNREFIPGESST